MPTDVTGGPARPAPPPPSPQVNTFSRAGFATMVTTLTVAQTLSTLTALVLPAIAPAAARGYGVPVYMIGYQASLLYGGMVIAMLCGTNVSLRWGGCRAVQAGLSLVALSGLLIATGSLALLVPASVLMGIGYGLITPASSHILLRFTPTAHRNVVFSIKQSGVPLGVVLAGTLGPALTVYASWEWTLVACGLASAIMIALLQIGRQRLDDDRDPQVPLITNPTSAVRVMWAEKPLRYLALGGGMLAASQVIQHNYTVAMFYEELGMPLVQAGLMLTVAQVGGFIGRPVWGWIADRSGDCRRVLMVLSVVLAASELATAALHPGWPLWSIYLLFFVFGATASGWHGAYLAEVARLAPAGRVAAATGGALVMTNANSVITPILFASIFAAIHSYSLTFALLAIPTLAALFLLRASRRMR